MSLPTTFEREYTAYCTQCSELVNTQIIKLINSAKNPVNEGSVHINLHNQNLNELVFTPISKALSRIGPNIISLDLSFNPMFKDCCAIHLESMMRNCTNLAYITLEKTGITDAGSISIISALTKYAAFSIKSINFGSLKVTDKFFDKLASTFKELKLQNLESLNLSNTKMSEKAAISLFVPLVQCSNLEKLNISMNSLRYKAGSCLLTLLTTNPKSMLKHIDLSYNPISKTLYEQIMQELSKRGEENKTMTDHIELQGINNIADSDGKFETPQMSMPFKDSGQHPKIGENLQETIPLENIENAIEENKNDEIMEFVGNMPENTNGEFIPEKFSDSNEKEKSPVEVEVLSVIKNTDEKSEPTSRRIQEKSPLKGTATFKNQQERQQNSNRQMQMTNSSQDSKESDNKTNDTEKILKDMPLNPNYQNLREKILKNKANAKMLHPFYARLAQQAQSLQKEQSEEKMSVNYSGILKENALGDEQDQIQHKPQKAQTFIVEELEQNFDKNSEFEQKMPTPVTAKTVYENFNSDSENNKKSIVKLPEIKKMIRDQIQKLVEFYRTIDSAVCDQDMIFELANQIVKESEESMKKVQIMPKQENKYERPKTVGRFTGRRFSTNNNTGREIKGRFIRKRNSSSSHSSSHFTQYSTNGSKVMPINNEQMNKYETEQIPAEPFRIIRGGMDENVYKGIITKQGILRESYPKRFIHN